MAYKRARTRPGPARAALPPGADPRAGASPPATSSGTSSAPRHQPAGRGPQGREPRLHGPVPRGEDALPARLPRPAPAGAARGRQAALRGLLHVRDDLPGAVHLHRGRRVRDRRPAARSGSSRSTRPSSSSTSCAASSAGCAWMPAPRTPSGWTPGSHTPSEYNRAGLRLRHPEAAPGAAGEPPLGPVEQAAGRRRRRSTCTARRTPASARAWSS